MNRSTSGLMLYVVLNGTGVSCVNPERDEERIGIEQTSEEEKKPQIIIPEPPSFEEDMISRGFKDPAMVSWDKEDYAFVSLDELISNSDNYHGERVKFELVPGLGYDTRFRTIGAYDDRSGKFRTEYMICFVAFINDEEPLKPAMDGFFYLGHDEWASPVPNRQGIGWQTTLSMLENDDEVKGVPTIYALVSNGNLLPRRNGQPFPFIEIEAIEVKDKRIREGILGEDPYRFVMEKSN